MSTLHLRITSNNSNCVLDRKLTPGRLILSFYTVRLPAAHGLTCLSIDIPWLNSGTKNTATASQRLVLPVSDATYTGHTPGLELGTTQAEVPQFFTVLCYETNSSTLVSAASFEIILFFSYLE